MCFYYYSLNFTCITRNTNFFHTWMRKGLLLRLIHHLVLQILHFWPTTLLFKLRQSIRCSPRIFYLVIFVCLFLLWLIVIIIRVHLILVAKGIVVLPKSVTPVRITSNFTGALAAANKLRFDVTDFRTLDGLAASGKQKRWVHNVSCPVTKVRCFVVHTDELFAFSCRFVTPPWRTYFQRIGQLRNSFLL